MKHQSNWYFITLYFPATLEEELTLTYFSLCALIILNLLFFYLFAKIMNRVMRKSNMRTNVQFFFVFNKRTATSIYKLRKTDKN